MHTTNFVEKSFQTVPKSVLLNDGSNLQIEEIVRVLPARRVVGRGQWQGQAVYAKIFYGHQAQAHCLRDIAGVTALMQANILTPPLLYQGQTQAGDGFVAIYAAIENAENAETLWWDIERDDRFSLAQKLTQTIAQHHRSGLIQTDLYFKNFLVQGEQIYSLDGDGIRQLRLFLQKCQRMQNLATLFSKMDVLDDVWIHDLYPLYCKTLGDQQGVADESEVWHLTQKIRRQIASRYADNKVFRTCTDVKTHVAFRQFLAVSSGFNGNAVSVAHLDGVLKNPSKNIKNGRTCTVAKADINGMMVVVKRYNIKSFWHGVIRAFRPSRAAISWANAHRLQLLKIATPQPLALLEERIGILRRRAYFLSGFVDAPDAVRYFNKCDNDEEKQLVANNIAILFYRLYLLKISHGDCKASNIKIVDGQPVLIDLDSMRAHSAGVFNWWFERQHVRDLKRLMKNWENDAQTSALLKAAFKQKYNEDYPYEEATILHRAGIA